MCPELTLYQQVLFRALARCPDVSLRVEIMTPRSPSHPFPQAEQLPYELGVADQRRRVDRRLIDRVLSEKHADVVVSSYMLPTLRSAMKALAGNRRRFLYWSDTPLPRGIQWNREFPAKRSFLRETVRNRFLKWIYRHAYRVLMTGHPGVMASVYLGCPPSKTVSFPYWVAVDPDRRPPAQDENRRHVVGLGQLIHRKGYDLALDAFAKAVNERIPEDVRLVLAGAGAAQAQLQREADTLGIADRVDFPGWLDDDGKRELFATAGAFIHPARWEPYGVVVLEAMEAGVAVLGSDQTMAVLDRITDGVSGLIHETGNINQLARHLCQVYADGDGLRRMGESARRTAEAWPPERSVEIIRDLLWDGAEK